MLHAGSLDVVQELRLDPTETTSLAAVQDLSPRRSSLVSFLVAVFLYSCFSVEHTTAL